VKGDDRTTIMLLDDLHALADELDRRFQHMVRLELVREAATAYIDAPVHPRVSEYDHDAYYDARRRLRAALNGVTQ